MTRNSKRRRPLVRGLLLLAVCGALAAAVGITVGYFGSASEPQVLTAPVALGSIEETVLATGMLEPAKMLNVGAQVSGQIKRLYVTSGQSVKAGDPIAEIDATSQKNALRIAEAALANITAQRKAREVQLAQARSTLNRQSELHSQKAASQADLETAQAAHLALEAEVASLDAQIAQAAVEVENARANLGYTKIVAPIDGTVIAIVTQQGQTLNAVQSTPTIIVLAQLDVMRVKVQISEADVSRVRAGQAVWFTILGDRQTRYETLLEHIEPAPSSIVTEAGSTAVAAGTAAVYYNGLLQIPNTDGLLRPLMTAQVHIVIAAAKDVPLIPWSVLGDPDEGGRYIVKVQQTDGTLVDREITVGITDRIQVQVLDGLNVGESVVVGTSISQDEEAGGDPSEMMFL